MGVLLDQLTHAGVNVRDAGNGNVLASGLTDSTRALIRAHKPEILAELSAANEPLIATHYVWWLEWADGRRAFEVRIVPEQTQAEVEALYQGATATPMTETMLRKAKN